MQSSLTYGHCHRGWHEVMTWVVWSHQEEVTSLGWQVSGSRPSPTLAGRALAPRGQVWLAHGDLAWDARPWVLASLWCRLRLPGAEGPVEGTGSEAGSPQKGRLWLGQDRHATHMKLIGSPPYSRGPRMVGPWAVVLRGAAAAAPGVPPTEAPRNSLCCPPCGPASLSRIPRRGLAQTRRAPLQCCTFVGLCMCHSAPRFWFSLL